MRFIGSCTMKALQKKVTDYFGNLQLGVGVANVHAIRAMLEIDPDWVLVCGDADYAFNSFTREQLFKEVRRHFPEALPYISIVKLFLRQDHRLQPMSTALWVSSKVELKAPSVTRSHCIPFWLNCEINFLTAGS